MSLSVTLAAFTALSDQAFWWGSTGNNLWSDPGNWRKGQKPAAGDFAYINADYCKSLDPGANPGLIIIDEAVTNVGIEVTVSSSAKTPEDCVPVTLRCVNGASVDMGRQTFSHNSAKFRLTLEDFVACNMDRFNTYGVLDIKGNSDINLKDGTGQNRCFHINNGADVTLWSGRLETSRFNYANMDKGVGRMCIRGGEFVFSSIDGDVGHENMRYEQLGGVVHFSSAGASMSRYPWFVPKGGKLVYDSNYGAALMPYVEANQVVDLGGELVMTNVTSSADSARIYMDRDNPWLISEVPQTFGRAYVTDQATYGSCRLPTLNVHAGFNSAASAYLLKFFGGLSLGAFGADLTWNRFSHTVYGPFVLRTADALDATVTRNISMTNVGLGRAPSIAVTGNGSVELLLTPSNIGSLTTGHPFQCSEVSVDAGATLYLYSNGTGCQALHANRIVLGDGATLDINYPLVMLRAFGRPSIGTGVKVKVRLPKNYKGELFSYPVKGKINPIVDFGAGADLSNVTAEITVNETGTDWTLAKMGSCIVAYDGTYAYDPPKDKSCWTGAGEDGKMSTVANWSNGAIPGTSANVYLDGITRMVVTNDFETQTGTLGAGRGMNMLAVAAEANSYHTSKAGPFTVRGNPIYLGAGIYTSSGASVFNGSECPLVIECDVGKSAGGNFSAVCNAQGWIGFMGKVAASGLNFVVGGDVVIGGKLTCGNLEFTKAYSTGRQETSFLTVIDGGEVIVENQTAVQTNGTKIAAKFAVAKGGLLEVRDGIFCNHHADMTACTVDGTARFAKLGGPKNFEICGKGVLELGGVVAVDGAPSSIAVGEGLTVRPASWETVSAAVPNTPITMTVVDDVTLGATNDWTYGAAAGVATETTAAQRALSVPDVGAKVTFDTEDPVTGEGHVITVAEPIVGPYVKVVKTGAGALYFASGANEVHSLDVRAGAFRWSEPQSFGVLKVAAGAELVCVANGGEIPTLAVDSDVDLDDVTVSVDGDVASWTGVLTVPAGRHIFGCPVAGERFRCRIVKTSEGGEALQFRERRGHILTIL